MKFFLLLISIAASGQSAKFEPRWLAGGHPDLQGVWHNSAIVDPPDGKLPYLPVALQQANKNQLHRETDPAALCHIHGVPHTLVPLFPVEIV
jgi:hypothetical protein